ncbi:UNVERIFIED_CONTAM: putative mitochondrial protein [Sesamum calycinum]|uniref:Mitochondrial protein n=1 Tax=Sesamum calycinum TaxID=2727403 RepID=A0AAW2JD16_9LAMI
MCKSKLEGGLGFRNLEAFNLALLAKQLWRLLSRPESLVCRVLKAKYFPHTHLFDAQLGTRPSFSWRSIMAAMHLLQCRWRIGTGHSVNIWTDPWLPRTPSFRIITPRPAHIHAVWVHELFSEDLHDWNVELIRAMFWPEDRTLSSNSLLASSARWICLCGTTQRMVYFRSVVPTTSLCLCPLKLALVGHVGLRSYGTKYGKLLRRTRRSCLFGELFVIFSPRQAICRSAFLMTIFHALFANQCLKALFTPFSTVTLHDRYGHYRIFGGTFLILHRCLWKRGWLISRPNCLAPNSPSSLVCWTIWWTRNLKLANKEFLLPLQVIEFAHNYLTAFSAHGNSFPKGLTASLENLHKWTHPPLTVFKVNFDGGVLDGGCALGIGILARNASGHCLAWLSLRLDRGGNAEMAEALAEALAAREAIHLALRHRWPRVIFEGDNSTLMNKISSVQADLSVISPLVADIRFFSSRIDYVSFSLVRRLGNSAADYLAGCALNRGGDASCLPPGLLSVIRIDNAE